MSLQDFVSPPKLEDYKKLLADAGNEMERQVTLQHIHEAVLGLELQRQADEVTEALRKHYLRPKARVYVATELLNELIKDLPIGSHGLRRITCRTHSRSACSANRYRR